jgi:hypothetical protein
MRAALFTAMIFAASGYLASTSADAAHHVNRHRSHAQPYYHYQPASESSRFPKTIDDFNVNGG